MYGPPSLTLRTLIAPYDRGPRPVAARPSAADRARGTAQPSASKARARKLRERRGAPPVVVVIQLFGLGRRPPGASDRPRWRRGRVGGRSNSPDARRPVPRLVRGPSSGPRTAVRSLRKSVFRPSAVLSSLHHAHRPLITPFRIRSEFAGRWHHAYFSDERHNNKEVLPP